MCKRICHKKIGEPFSMYLGLFFAVLHQNLKRSKSTLWMMFDFFLQSLGISIILETTMELNFSTQLTILSSYYLLYSISVLKIHVGVNFSCFGIVHSCYFANLVNFMAVRYKALPTKCKLHGSTPGDTNNFTSYFGY